MLLSPPTTGGSPASLPHCRCPGKEYEDMTQKMTDDKWWGLVP
ncbi:hypothetical protein STXM2123_1927 [Streptomyces sp. F-3]|nr:hypothetical protein STXM2123_1927 [Streptomyces sp. F-3]